jgi:hypothetical protein
MTLEALINNVTNKERFRTVQDYIDFCSWYLEYTQTGLQARIVSQNESHYQFFQYRDDAGYNITRPINTLLMYNADTFAISAHQFLQVFSQLREREHPADNLRQVVIRTIYTIQQSIGAALDALPAGKSNQARKINGDLFERLVCLLNWLQVLISR